MEIRLTRFTRTRDALLSAWPWYATIALLVAFNFGAAPLLERRPAWIPWLGVLNLVVVLAGLFAQRRRSAAPPPEFKLLVARDRVEVRDASGVVLWGASRRGLAVTREIFALSSRWGTYRYHVLGLRPSTQDALAGSTKPLFLLDQHSLAQGASGKRGVVPQYAVATPEDFAKLSRDLGQ